MEGSSVSYGKSTSYEPVIDLLKGYFKVTDRDTPREIREKVTGKLLTLDEGLRAILSPILALLDVPVEDARWTNLDPEQRRARTLEAVKRLLLRESQEQPLLVVFEDLQWIDGETQAVLDGLVKSLPAARLLLLVNYRPEYGHGWGSKTYYTQLRLDALPAETASELLDALVGRDASVEPLKPLLTACTGGNPLFLEESVRGLVETHAPAAESGPGNPGHGQKARRPRRWPFRPYGAAWRGTCRPVWGAFAPIPVGYSLPSLTARYCYSQQNSPFARSDVDHSLCGTGSFSS